MPYLFKGEKAVTVVEAGWSDRQWGQRGKQIPDYEASVKSLDFILMVMGAIESL